VRTGWIDASGRSKLHGEVESSLEQSTRNYDLVNQKGFAFLALLAIVGCHAGLGDCEAA
jgi:hypothetical protein